MAKSSCAECGKCALTTGKAKFYRVHVIPACPVFCSPECLWAGGVKYGREVELVSMEQYAQHLLNALRSFR